MGARRPVLPWAFLGIFFALEIGSSILRPSVDVESLFGIPFMAFALVGALIAWRLPANPIGWIYLGTAVGAALGVFSFDYAYRSFVMRTEPLPLADLFAWMSSWVFLPGIATLVTFGLLLFPTGGLPSRRWRPVGITAAVLVPALTAALALRPGPLEQVSAVDTASVENPVGLEAARDLTGGVVAAGFPVMALLAFLSVLSLVARFRRGSAEERQQIKWFAFASSVLALSFPFDRPLEQLLGHPAADVFFASALTLPPLAVGVAILRFRLYDIDLIINRALVYGVLTAALLAAYFVIVVSLTRVLEPVTHDSDLAVAASTLAVAALFGPVRARIQEFIDRRFYRRKYDSARALGGLTGRLRDEIGVDAIRRDVLGVVEETLQPAQASLWLGRRKPT